MAGASIQDRPPTEKELVEVSKHIGAGFELLGAYLGINSIKIQQIMMNNSFSVETQIFKILVAWKQKEGRQATVRKLLEAVKNSPGNINVGEIERIFDT